MSNPQILHIITRSEWGGAQRIVELLATRSEADADVLCAPDGPLVERLERFDIPVYERSSLVRQPSPTKDAKALASITKLLRTEDYDVVHCHSTKAGLIGRVAAAIAQVPVVFTVHGWGFYNTEINSLRPAIAGIERLLAAITDTIVCVSQNDYEQGRKRGILSSDQDMVIRNGIPPVTPSEGPSVRETFGIHPETVVIGSLGRLAEQKDPLSILQTGNTLAGSGLDVATILIGDGPLRKECERFATNSEATLHVAGFREDALRLLAGFDIFLLPSRFEGLPLTVLEAMHLGVPVIAYDVGGVAEAIIDEKTGKIIEPGNFDEFIESTKALLQNGERRQELGKSAHEHAKKKFCAKRMIRDYDMVYEEAAYT